MNRREFLKVLGVGSTVLIAGSISSSPLPPRRQLYRSTIDRCGWWVNRNGEIVPTNIEGLVVVDDILEIMPDEHTDIKGTAVVAILNHTTGETFYEAKSYFGFLWDVENKAPNAHVPTWFVRV